VRAISAPLDLPQAVSEVLRQRRQTRQRRG
jgi:hypothetical protein